jgi:hypothetical protein
MPAPEVTCWRMIRDASGGDPAARERFARAYLPVVKAYLVARWLAGRGGRGPRGVAPVVRFGADDREVEGLRPVRVRAARGRPRPERTPRP